MVRVFLLFNKPFLVVYSDKFIKMFYNYNTPKIFFARKPRSKAEQSTADNKKFITKRYFST